MPFLDELVGESWHRISWSTGALDFLEDFLLEFISPKHKFTVVFMWVGQSFRVAVLLFKT